MVMIMEQINVLFQGILFSIWYECDDDGCYVMSANINDVDWIDSLTEKSVSELNKALVKALEENSKDLEMERQLSDMGKTNE